MHLTRRACERLDPVEPADVVDLVEHGQRENRADAGDRSEAVERIRVVALHLANQRLLEVGQARRCSNAADVRALTGTTYSAANQLVQKLVGHGVPAEITARSSTGAASRFA
jgi:hypothetical protein